MIAGEYTYRELEAEVARLRKALDSFARLGRNPNLLPNGAECDLRCGLPTPRDLRDAAAALEAK